MSYLDPSTRTMIQERITRKQAVLQKAYAALEVALDPERAPISSYKFNSGEGDQYASHRKPEDIQRSITQLENQIQRDVNRLNGTGVMHMNLRRRR